MDTPANLLLFLKLDSLDDVSIYHKAKAARFVIIISKDSDLPEIVARLGAPPKVINVRNIGNADNRIFYRFLKANIERCIRLLIQYENTSIELNKRKQL